MSDTNAAVAADGPSRSGAEPWLTPHEGEVWIITPSKSLSTLDGPGEYPAIFQAGRFRDHGGSWEMHDITAARRIWPEAMRSDVSLALFRMSILKDSYASLTEDDRKALAKKLPQHFTSALSQLIKSAVLVESAGQPS